MRDLSYNEIMKLKHLDLFSGIGGFSLGLEATGGFETKAFCDIEEYPRQVLQKHWPHVKQYEDIKELNYERLKADGIDSIDIITGGYPCQPFSIAGRQKGEQDPRHLWPEYFRLVKELRPTWVIGENVSGHIKLGLDTVIEDLESEDYAVRPFSISASSIGANHQRERIWILAHSRRSQWPRAELRGENENETRKENANQFERSSSTSEFNVANTQSQWSGEIKNIDKEKRNKGGSETQSYSSGGNVANTKSERLQRGQWNNQGEGREVLSSERQDGNEIRSETGRPDRVSTQENVSNPSSSRRETGISEERYREEGNTEESNNDSDRRRGWQRENNWAVEPDVGRVAHGIPKRVDRLKSLGNSLVPQIPYYIGKTILEVMNGKTN
jgi:DNA (cytosine-5)-methyltransferase 1